MDAGKSLREHGLRIGELEPGRPPRSRTWVVGHVTVRPGRPDPPTRRGPHAA